MNTNIREDHIQVDKENEIDFFLFKEEKKDYFIVLAVEHTTVREGDNISGRSSIKLHQIFADQESAEEFYNDTLSKWK